MCPEHGHSFTPFVDLFYSGLGFNAVTTEGQNGKFKNSSQESYKELNPEECDDLKASIAAVKKLLEGGPGYDFTSFRGGTKGPGEVIGGSRFW